MQKSLIIARLVGPVLSAIGIGMLVNQPSYCEIIAPQFATFIVTALIASASFFTGLGIFLPALGGFITFKGYIA